MIERELRKKYLGVPYKHGGRDLSGLDCYGLIISLYKDLGIDLIDINNYAVDWAKDNNYFIENYYKQWEKVSFPKLFDVVLIKMHQGNPDHCGLYLSDGKILHTNKAGTIVTPLSQFLNIDGFYRFKR